MKTSLNLIKNQYAQERGYEDWDELATIMCYTNGYQMESYMNEICIRVQKAALENAAENVEIEMDLETDWYSVNKESITNEQNLIR